MLKIKQLFSIADTSYELGIIKSGDFFIKILSCCQFQIRNLVEEHLLEAIVLNTAHPKSSVRKSSRSCIANFVRYYKDLRVILKAFRTFGIEMNENVYSKQCVILILPNLLNLD